MTSRPDNPVHPAANPQPNHHNPPPSPEPLQAPSADANATTQTYPPQAYPYPNYPYPTQPPRPKSHLGLILALVGAGVALFGFITILTLSLLFILLFPVTTLDANVARAQQPWTGGGGIIADNSLCSTAGLGTYQGRWAILTAAHCVNNQKGTTVTTISGEILGTSVWVGNGVDLAIIDIHDQSAITANDARVWTGTWNDSTSAPISGTTTVEPGTGNVWLSGIQLGTVGGRGIGAVDTTSRMDDGEVLTHVRQLQGPDSVTLAVEGMSGGGAYIKDGNTWNLWGVITRGSEPLHDCDTYLGPDTACTHDAYVAPISPALDAGFTVATHPSTQP